MKKGISLVLVMFLIMGLGCAAFADGALDVVGTVEGQIYTSKTLRLKAEFPEDWILLSDEQIAAEMEFPEGYNTREGLARLLEEYYGTCALSAESTDGSRANLNLMIQDTFSPDILSEQDFYDVSVEALPETLTAQGYQNVTVRQGEFILKDADGKPAGTHVMAVVSAEIGDITLCEYTVFIKEDHYVGILNLIAPSAETADQMLGFFSAYSA